MANLNESIKADYKLVNDGMGVTIEALFKGMEGLVQSKTVVGEPICIDDTKIVPLIEVSAGMASGALAKNNNGAGAMSAKISPVALLILQGGRVRLVNVKNQDVFTRLFDLIPEAVDRLTGAVKKNPNVEEKISELTGAEDVKTVDPENISE